MFAHALHLAYAYISMNRGAMNKAQHQGWENKTGVPARLKGVLACLKGTTKGTWQRYGDWDNARRQGTAT